MQQNNYAMIIDKDGYQRYWAGDCWSRHTALRQRITENDSRHKHWRDDSVFFEGNNFPSKGKKLAHNE